MDIPYKDIRTKGDLKDWCRKQGVPIFKEKHKGKIGSEKDYVLRCETAWGDTYQRFQEDEGLVSRVEELTFSRVRESKGSPIRYVGHDGVEKRATFDISRLGKGEHFIFQD